MKTLAWLVKKELQVFLSDRNGALKTFVLPVLLAALISALFATRSKTGTVELLVVDEDGGAPARALVAAVDRVEALAVTEVTRAEAERLIAEGKAGVALVLPRGTSEVLRPARLFLGESIEAQLLHDPSRDIEAEMSSGLFRHALVDELLRSLQRPEARIEALEDVRVQLLGPWEALADQALDLARRELEDPAAPPPAPAPGADPATATTEPALRLPIELEPQAIVAAGPAAGYNSFAHNFAGMLCMFALFLAQDMARALLLERRSGVIVRARLAAPTPLVPLLSLATTTTLLTLVLTAVMFGVAIALFGVELLGGLVAFVVVALALALFAGGFAVALAGLARTDKEIAALGTAFILLSSFIGGAWYPRFLMPDWLQSISAAIPTSWATDGFAAATWRGLPLDHALVPAALLAAAAAALIALGRWRFRWEERDH